MARYPLHFAFAFAALLTGSAGFGALDLERISNIVVIYAENRSFDHLYGLFPGADGIAQASAEQKTQLDRDGRPLPYLPPAWRRGKPDPTFPAHLPNGPVRLDAPPVNLSPAALTRDLIHLFHVHQEQINGGKNNMFAALSDAGGFAMGYYDGSQMAMWKLAREFVLADHFFQGAYGGSFLNHQWLVCACTPYNPQAPAKLRTQLDERGRLKVRENIPSALNGPLWFLESIYTPDGYAVNTMQPPYQPSEIPPARGGDERFAASRDDVLAPQTTKTIGDTLSAKEVSWVWYAGGWNEALADSNPPDGRHRVIYNGRAGSPNFQPHHQPFNYFVRFAPGKPDRDAHLKDYRDLLAALAGGTLPQVAFYKPPGSVNQHPGESDIMSADTHIAELVGRIRASRYWPSVMIIVTYDENGGFWDHVPPPSGPGWSDRFGPGTRIPAIIISPFAKRGFVDKTPYDTTSILKFITERFGLEPLPGVREKAGDLTNALSFSP
jgi:acid phosphatase